VVVLWVGLGTSAGPMRGVGASGRSKGASGRLFEAFGRLLDHPRVAHWRRLGVHVGRYGRMGAP